MSSHEERLLEDLFWGLSSEVSDLVCAAWIFGLTCSAQLTDRGTDGLTFTLAVDGRVSTGRVLPSGGNIFDEEVGDDHTDAEFAHRVGVRFGPHEPDTSEEQLFDGIVDEHGGLLQLLTDLVAGGLEVKWSADERSAATTISAHRDGQQWVGAEWQRSARGNWGFVTEKTWLLDSGERSVEDATFIGQYALWTAPDWTLTAPLPAAKHGEIVPPPPVREFTLPAHPTADELAARKRQLSDWTARNGFLLTVDAPTPSSISKHLIENGACVSGLYAIEFTDGTCYVGQSTDIGERFRRHSKTYEDISSIRLRPEPASLTVRDPSKVLLKAEKEMIHDVQDAGLIARNKAEMTTILLPGRKLDDLISSAEQDDWRANRIDRNLVDLNSHRSPDAQSLNIVGRRDFERLRGRLSDTELDEVLNIVAAFLARCVLLPVRTEVVHWTISCMPGNGDVLARLSVGWTEVLAIFRSTTGALSGRVQARSTDLAGGNTESGWITFGRRHPEVRITDSTYEFCKGNVLVDVDGLGQLRALVDDVETTRAVATAALDLMRIRVSPRTRIQTHNTELARECLARAPRFCI